MSTEALKLLTVFLVVISVVLLVLFQSTLNAIPSWPTLGVGLGSLLLATITKAIGESHEH